VRRPKGAVQTRREPLLARDRPYHVALLPYLLGSGSVNCKEVGVGEEEIFEDRKARQSDKKTMLTIQYFNDNGNIEV
jgi:hypothetical protein